MPALEEDEQPAQADVRQGQVSGMRKEARHCENIHHGAVGVQLSQGALHSRRRSKSGHVRQGHVSRMCMAEEARRFEFIHDGAVGVELRQGTLKNGIQNTGDCTVVGQSFL